MKFVIEVDSPRYAQTQFQVLEESTETAAIDHAVRIVDQAGRVGTIVRVFRVGEQVATVVNKTEVTR